MAKKKNTRKSLGSFRNGKEMITKPPSSWDIPKSNSRISTIEKVRISVEHKIRTFHQIRGHVQEELRFTQ